MSINMMKVFLIVLILFLTAFAGLAAGLILKRKGLRGGCGSGSAQKNDCQCRSNARQRHNYRNNHL